MRRFKNLQVGTTAIEVALTLSIFLAFIMGIIEMARLVYIMNTVQEVTRSAAQAAANTNFTDSAAMDQLRQRAIFRPSSGNLLLGDPINDTHVRVDYLASVKNGSQQVLTPVATLPASPASNRGKCIADPNDPNCIRFVRVRICESVAGGVCIPLPYSPIVPMVPFNFNVPTATTIVTANSLGL